MELVLVTGILGTFSACAGSAAGSGALPDPVRELQQRQRRCSRSHPPRPRAGRVIAELPYEIDEGLASVAPAPFDLAEFLAARWRHGG